jgi:hypothetical protein
MRETDIYVLVRKVLRAVESVGVTVIPVSSFVNRMVDAVGL